MHWNRLHLPEPIKPYRRSGGWMAQFGGCETSNPRKGRELHLISSHPFFFSLLAFRRCVTITRRLDGRDLEAKVRANSTSPSLAGCWLWQIEPPWLSQRGWATCTKKNECLPSFSFPLLSFPHLNCAPLKRANGIADLAGLRFALTLFFFPF